jgi:hypothetical protein
MKARFAISMTSQHSRPRSTGTPCDFPQVCGRPGAVRGRQLPRGGLRPAQFGYRRHLKKMRVFQI